MHSENDDVSTEGFRGPTPSGPGPAAEAGPEGAEIQARLKEIDKRLAELRATLADQPDGPGDQVDAATTLTLQDEITMMVETLENEKRRLLEGRRENPPGR